jgi:hypothetical protein
MTTISEESFLGLDKCLPYRQKEAGFIIGLTGFAQSGKDSVGQILVRRAGFKRLAFADALRVSLYKLNPKIESEIEIQSRGFWEWISGEPPRTHKKEIRVQDLVKTIGWDEAKVKYPEIRELLQKLGTESGREIHGQDCWTNIIKRQIAAEPYQNFVITDVRFPNEADVIKSMGGTVIKIEREGIGSVNGHISDKGIDNWEWKLENNSSFEALEGNLMYIYDMIQKERRGEPIDIDV